MPLWRRGDEQIKAVTRCRLRIPKIHTAHSSQQHATTVVVLCVQQRDIISHFHDITT